MNIFSGNGFSFPLGKRTYVMGILNYTPDSFSDGGVYFSPDKLVEHALLMEENGADIIDLGAASSAPGSDAISAQEELLRLKEVLVPLRERIKVPLSLDTSNAASALYAAENGVSIINDESGYFNENIAAVVREYNLGWVIMHTGGASSRDALTYPNGVVKAVSSYFGECLTSALELGINRENLCFDIGIGFGKSYEDNLKLLRPHNEFCNYHALLFGTSRKRVIGIASGASEPSERVFGTVAADTAAIAAGADVIRVHDVAAALQGARVADAVFR